MKKGRGKQWIWIVGIFAVVAVVIYFASGNTTLTQNSRMLVSGIFGIIGGFVAGVATAPQD